MMDRACGVGSAEAEDVAYRERLFMEHQYLCRRGARKFCRVSDDRADLEQTAAVGLIKAADRFRLDRGTPFEAFAWIFIEGELSHYVRDCERMVRPPRRLRAVDRRWREAGAALREILGREPSNAELRDHLGADLKDERELFEYRARARVESLDLLALETRSAGYYTIEREIDRLVLEGAMRALTELEREVVVATVVRDATANEIAASLGYSERHVSRIRKAALQKLARACGEAVA